MCCLLIVVAVVQGGGGCFGGVASPIYIAHCEHTKREHIKNRTSSILFYLPFDWQFFFKAVVIRIPEG